MDKTELVWEGKYTDGSLRRPPRITLPFQVVETVNEATKDRQQMLLRPSETAWRNRLIWGDKKYVLPSLLDEFQGKVDLIYIDPPFDSGANFSYTAHVPAPPRADYPEELTFVKAPNMIEEKAYRDTWGRSPDSYLQWLYETAILLRELLAETGCVYVHLDWRKSHYIKVVMDEVFGVENFLDNVVWEYQTRHSSDRFWNRKHDDILLYKKSDRWTFNWRDEDVMQKLSDATIAKYRLKDNKGLYRLNGRFLKGSPIKGAKDVDQKWERTHPDLVVRDYLRPGIPPNDYFFIPIENQNSLDRTNYPTQKPTALLRKLIKASSNKNDLVLDCFVGSGTTAAVAEALGRRWIVCDLSRFSIHTTRKRLLDIPDVRPFDILNLGKYERQAWQRAEFRGGSDEERRSDEALQNSYRSFIVDLYRAKRLNGYAWLHGIRAGRLVHVASVDAPVTANDVTQIVAEAKRLIGSGPDAPTRNAIDVLGWDFAFDVNEVVRQQAASAKISLRFLRIPREVMDPMAVEQGDVNFYELNALSVDLKLTKRRAFARLTDFVIPPDDVPQDIQKQIKHWSQWVDYWAIDWDNHRDAFHNEWQSFRTREEETLELSASHEYQTAGRRVVVIKVVDILGNDTTKSLDVSIT